MKNEHGSVPGFLLPYHVEMRYTRPLFNTMKQIRCSMSTEELIREILGNLCLDFKEYFWAIFMTRSHHVLSVVRISEGGHSSTIVSTKEIAQLAMLSHASAVIVFHNHPSGNIQPSMADIKVTHQLKKALELFDVDLLDHLIITTEDYFSFGDEGQL